MVLAANYAFDIARDKKEEEKKVPREGWEEYIEEAESEEQDDWELEFDEEEPVNAVETPEKPKEVRVARVLQTTPTKRRVLFDNGKEGWVNKGDEDKIIYM